MVFFYSGQMDCVAYSCLTGTILFALGQERKNCLWPKFHFPPLKLKKSNQKTMKLAYPGRVFIFLALCTLHAMQDSYSCIFFVALIHFPIIWTLPTVKPCKQRFPWLYNVLCAPFQIQMTMQMVLVSFSKRASPLPLRVLRCIWPIILHLICHLFVKSLLWDM